MPQPALTRLQRYVRLETGLLAGGLMTLAGAALLLVALSGWATNGFGALDTRATLASQSPPASSSPWECRPSSQASSSASWACHPARTIAGAARGSPPTDDRCRDAASCGGGLCTRSGSYADWLRRSQTRPWKRALRVQAVYRWNLRRLQPGVALDIGCGNGRNLSSLIGGVWASTTTRVSSLAIAGSRGFQVYTREQFQDSPAARPGYFDTLPSSHTCWSTWRWRRRSA